MVIIDNIHFGDLIKEKKKNKIISKISKRKNIFNINIIVIRLKNRNLMEVVSTRELYRLEKREKEIFVIGIAKDKQEALILIENIIFNTYSVNGLIEKNNLIRELGIA